MGGWVGAVPMALDWDRDWQAWPVTVLLGVYGGWGMGRLLTVGREGWGLGLGCGRRVDLREDDAWEVGGGDDDDDRERENVKSGSRDQDERAAASGDKSIARVEVGGRNKKRQ